MEKTEIKDVKQSSYSFLTIGYVILRDFPVKVFPWSEMVRTDLRRSAIGISYIPYISSMFFWVITTFVLSIIISLFVLGIIQIAPLSPQTFLMSLAVASACATICFSLFLYYPKYTTAVKRREIEKNLVYISNYMSIMANSGATVEQLFQSLATHGEIYGTQNLARNIIRNVEILGQDIITSLDEAAKYSPSTQFSRLLQGFIATMKTGGSLSSYLSSMSQEYIESRRQLLSKLIEQLNLVGELYISALVALPVIFITMFTIMGFLGGSVLGGLSSTQLMPLLIYVFIPFLAAGLLVYIDAILASW